MEQMHFRENLSHLIFCDCAGVPGIVDTKSGLLPLSSSILLQTVAH